MRIPRILPILLAVCLGIFSLQAQTVDAPLERFKKDMAALNTYSRKKGVELKANPLAGMLIFRSLLVEAKAVQTDALPDDLKAAFSDAIITMTKAVEIFEGWPDQPDDAIKYLRERVAEDPQYMETFSAKMNAVGKQMATMSKRLDEMGNKYGFENLQTGDSAHQ